LHQRNETLNSLAMKYHNVAKCLGNNYSEFWPNFLGSNCKNNLRK